jgi:hypothetical protein
VELLADAQRIRPSLTGGQYCTFCGEFNHYGVSFDHRAKNFSLVARRRTTVAVAWNGAVTNGTNQNSRERYPLTPHHQGASTTAKADGINYAPALCTLPKIEKNVSCSYALL